MYISHYNILTPFGDLSFGYLMVYSFPSSTPLYSVRRFINGPPLQYKDHSSLKAGTAMLCHLESSQLRRPAEGRRIPQLLSTSRMTLSDHNK